MKYLSILLFLLPSLILGVFSDATAAIFNGYAFTAIDTYVGNTAYSALGNDSQNIVYGGPYQTRSANGLTAYSSQADNLTIYGQAVASLAIYGSNTSRTGYVNNPSGVEPMIDIALSTSGKTPTGQIYGEATPIDAVFTGLAEGYVSVQHRVYLNSALPSSVNVASILNNIPLEVLWSYDFGTNNIDASYAEGWIRVGSPTGDCADGVGGACGGFAVNIDNGLPTGSGSIPFTAVATTEARTAIYDIELYAYASIAGGDLRAIIDPYLTIDPNWEYAPYFTVQQESTVNPGEWVPLSRDYLNPVPLPSAVWLFGSGLAGLLAIARRKKA